MKFAHRTRVRAPLKAVARFHAESASMASITPPPIQVRVTRAPRLLHEGDRMVFTLGMGPLLIPWTARIADVTANGFTDTQESGPFARWVHRHSYRTTEPGVTEVIDEVEATLLRRGWWGLLGLAMWLGMPLLFAYRGWRTRVLLEREA